MEGKFSVKPNELREDSVKLACNVIESGFKPDFMIAVWRGGTPIGCYMHEMFKWFGISCDHIAVRTSRYTGIDQVSENAIRVHSTSYLSQTVKKESKVLIVDDVYDTGLSIGALLDTMKARIPPENYPSEVRIATVFWKPSRNKTQRNPDYYIHTTNEWIVFPHEVEGLTLKDIAVHMSPTVAQEMEKVQKHLGKS